MNCFELEDWVDFVRQAMPAARLAEMERHLKTGCERCTRATRLWRSLRDLAAKQSSYEPPEDMVRLVKASFHGQVGQKTERGIAMVATLIFDSARQPRLVGIRASRQPLPQQLLYAAGDYLVDIRIEGGSGQVSLAGQIMSSSRPKHAIKNVPVALLSGGNPIAESVSSSLGEFEFQIELQPAKDLQLAIGLSGTNCVSIFLRNIKPAPKRGGGAWQRNLRPCMFGGHNPFRHN